MPHLVPISIALVALPRVKAQMHSCTKDRDLWLCCCHPLGSRPELTWKTGLTLWGFQGEDTNLFSWLQFPPIQRTVQKWLIVVYFVPFSKASKLFQVTSNVQIKQAKISLGMRYLLPCILWRAVSDYKDFLYAACFICHLFPIWTLWSPDLSDGATACFMTRKAAVPLLRHTLAAHFWQKIDGISAANSWMR